MWSVLLQGNCRSKLRISAIGQTDEAVGLVGRDRLVVYLVDGARPTPTAQQMVDAVLERRPDAALTFEVDPASSGALKRTLVIDDHTARDEWGWAPRFDLDAMIDDFLDELAG